MLPLQVHAREAKQKSKNKCITDLPKTEANSGAPKGSPAAAALRAEGALNSVALRLRSVVFFFFFFHHRLSFGWLFCGGGRGFLPSAHA